MLGKLIKHDLKWVYKGVIIFYVLSVFFSILGRIFIEIEDSALFNILGKISFGFAISMMINSIINCVMRLWARFVRNIYKDESYLTHTLPVAKKTIYQSKIITSLITIITSVLVTIASLYICYYSKENLDILKKVLELAATTYDTTVIKLVLLISLVFLIEIIYIVFIGYVGIILGHKRNNHKMLMSIIIAFALYMIMQTLTLVGLVIYGAFNPDIMNLINTTSAVDITAIKSAMYFSIINYAIYIIFLYVLGKKQLEKGVNVD